MLLVRIGVIFTFVLVLLSASARSQDSAIADKGDRAIELQAAQLAWMCAERNWLDSATFRKLQECTKYDKLMAFYAVERAVAFMKLDWGDSLRTSPDAEAALRLVDDSGTNALLPLASHINSENKDVFELAASALTNVKTDESVDLLIIQMMSSSGRRRLAAASLGLLGPKARKALPWLVIAFLREENTFYKGHMALAISRIMELKVPPEDPDTLTGAPPNQGPKMIEAVMKWVRDYYGNALDAILRDEEDKKTRHVSDKGRTSKIGDEFQGKPREQKIEGEEQ